MYTVEPQYFRGAQDKATLLVVREDEVTRFLLGLHFNYLQYNVWLADAAQAKTICSSPEYSGLIDLVLCEESFEGIGQKMIVVGKEFTKRKDAGLPEIKERVEQMMYGVTPKNSNFSRN